MGILGALLLALSMAGYGLTVYQKLKLKIEFVPIFVFSSLIVVLFFAGLWNIMPLICYCVLGGGVALFCLIVYKSAKSRSWPIERRDIFVPGILVIAGLGIYFMLQFRGARLIHIDNYTHWAAIVKDMLLKDSLPNFESSTVIFRSYPPGSALFLYFGAKLTGNTDGRLMMLQMVLMLSCLFCLFAFVDFYGGKDKRFETIIKRFAVTILMSVSTVYLLSSPTSVYDLLVDTLLHLYSAAGIAAAIYYRNDIMKAALLSCPIMCVTILLKNVGVFFVLIQSVYLIYLIIKKRRPTATDKKNDDLSDSEKRLLVSRKYTASVCLMIVIPFVCLFLWHKHTEYTFGSNNLSTHQVSVEGYKSALSAKSREDINNITEIFIATIFDFDKNAATKRICFWNACFIAIYLLGRLYKQKERRYLYSIILADTVYLLYLLGLYCIYLFSFSTSEAMLLAQYERYIMTAFRYIESFLLIGLALMIHRAENLIQAFLRSACSLLTLAALCYSSYGLHWIRTIFTKPQYEDTAIQRVESAITFKDSSASCVVYAGMGADASGYIYHMSKYTVWTSKVRIVYEVETVKNKEAFLELLSTFQFEYFVIVEEDEYIREFMISRDIIKDSYIGTYSVQELLKTPA